MEIIPEGWRSRGSDFSGGLEVERPVFSRRAGGRMSEGSNFSRRAKKKCPSMIALLFK